MIGAHLFYVVAVKVEKEEEKDFAETARSIARELITFTAHWAGES